MLSRKHKLSTRFFYSKLNREEKRFYRVLAENLLKQNYEFEYEINWGFMDPVKSFRAVIDDFPELFYVDFNSMDWGRGKTIAIVGKILYSKEEIKRLHLQMEKILHKFDHISDPFELQVAVNDFICKEYTYSMDARGPKTRQERHTVVGLLKRKKGVCSAFSKLAQFILQRRGVSVAYLSAETDSLEEDGKTPVLHAWLAVKHEGEYYHWDITNVHGEAGDEETTQYRTFNVTDEELISEGTHYKPEEFFGLTCTKTDYNYYHRKGLYFKTYEEIHEGCIKFIKEMDLSKGINWFNFRISPEIDNEKSKEYTPSLSEIKELLAGTGYSFAKFTSFFYRDGLGYYRCKLVTKKERKMKLTVVQPKYYQEGEPCVKIREYLKSCLEGVEENEIIVLPEYSNAGGTADPEIELEAVAYADEMKQAGARVAKEKGAYVAVNVLERREGRLRNSTYLYDKRGKVAFVYDKVHLPPAEKSLGVERGNGECTAVVDGIRFAFMTCYDIYFNEQIEHIAKFKPDVIILPGYQRGERVDIIKAQATLLAYRCNAFVLRSSYSMDKDNLGGCSLIALPIGKIEACLGKDEGVASSEQNIVSKCYRPAGFGGEYVLNDKFIDDGLCPEVFEELSAKGKGKK